MKLDPETREKAAQDARAAYYPNLPDWDLLSEGGRNLWREIADAVAATIPEPTPADGPQPIDPADVRVGDRVRVSIDATVTRAPDRHIDAADLVGLLSPEDYSECVYLLDRRALDADLIEVMAERAARADDAFHGDAHGEWPARFPAADAYRTIARAALAALRETHTIEPRPTGGDIRA